MFSLKQFNTAMKQKPKEVRAMYAFWSAAVVTSVLALGWLVTIPSAFDRIANEHQEESQPTGNFANVMQSMRANITDAMSTFRDVQVESSELLEEISGTGDSAAVATSTVDTINFTDFFIDENSIDEDEWQNEDEWIYDEDAAAAEPVSDTVVVSTSTNSVMRPESLPTEPRRVLIATTSARTSTTTNSE